MRNILFLIIFLVTFSSIGQHQISGKFSPASDYSWLIAYRLKPGTQVYVADTAIENGDFSLTIPEDSPAGMYRLVYAVPQEEFYFDVLYNGKEAVELTFNLEDDVQFISSEENVLLQAFKNEITSIEKNIIDFYLAGETNKKGYLKLANKSKEIQKLYEEKSKGLLAHEFITASNLPIPETHSSIEDYVAFKKSNYFKTVDVKNPTLLAATFLTDKICNYVFTAVSLHEISLENTQNEITENVNLVYSLIQDNSDAYRLHVLFSLWSQAAASNYNFVSDFIYNKHLKTLADSLKNKEIINQIEAHNRLRFGARAPEIIWQENQKEKSLTSLSDAENYILVFWSSTCSHCLKELPNLHKELKEITGIQVIAVGLEDDDITWKNETAKLPDFKHAISLEKWDSEYAKLYNIHATPTYYILDSEKRIIAKPENNTELIEFFKTK